MDNDVPARTQSTVRINHQLLTEMVRNTGFELPALSADIVRKTWVRVPLEVLSWLVWGKGEEVAPTPDALRAVAAYFGMQVSELFLAHALTASVEVAIDGATDLPPDDKAVLLHLYRRLRKEK